MGGSAFGVKGLQLGRHKSVLTRSFARNDCGSGGMIARGFIILPALLKLTPACTEFVDISVWKNYSGCGEEMLVVGISASVTAYYSAGRRDGNPSAR